MGLFGRIAERWQERRAERQARRFGNAQECQPVVEQTSGDLEELKTQVQTQQAPQSQPQIFQEQQAPQQVPQTQQAQKEQLPALKPEYQKNGDWHQFFFEDPGRDIHFTFRKADGTVTSRALVFEKDLKHWAPYPELDICRHQINGKNYVTFSARGSFEGASIAMQQMGSEAAWVNVPVTEPQKPESKPDENEIRKARVMKAISDMKEYLELSKTHPEPNEAAIKKIQILLVVLEATFEAANLNQEQMELLKKEKDSLKAEIQKRYPQFNAVTANQQAVSK